MVTIVKHEWHQHDRQYAIELDEDLLSENYPDLDEDEIAEKLKQIEDGDVDYEEVINDAYENDVEIEWEFQYDDCWTDRKGGYDVTYELGDDDSWHSDPPPPEPTHKCTKCKWVGQSYDADWVWPEDETGEKEAKKVCPMCDSDTELTEVGIKEEKEKQERMARAINSMEEEEEEEPVSETDLLEALEDLKREFDALSATAQVVPMKCSVCDWTGDWTDTTSNDDEEDTCPECGSFVENAKESEPAKWPFDNPVEGEVTETEEQELLPNYPAGEYTIRIWGRTREIGVSKIKKAQYDYWTNEEWEDSLSDALNENFDYDEHKTPKAARFDSPYYEYQDKISFWGFDQDDTHMTIENSEGEEIYNGDLESFVAEAHGEEDSRWDATEEQDELYPNYLGKGYWLYWTQGGKGSCIQTTISVEEGEEFDPRKLKVLNWDIEGTSVVTRLVYDGVELGDDGMDSEHDNWRGQWSTFSVHHNTK